MTQPPNHEINSALAVVETKLENIAEDVGEIKEVLTSQYVHRNEFRPVELITYGLVSTVLLSFIGAVMALLLRGGGP